MLLLFRFVEWIKEMGHRGFPLPPIKIKAAVKLYLDRCKIQIKQFSNNRPGKSWWYAFWRRHPDLKITKSEKLEKSRAMACTEEAVSKWFREFDELLKELGITSPQQIYNVDESGFPLQSKNTLRVCVDKLIRRNFQQVSANKDSITSIQCICANGTVLPPSVLFPGKNFNPEYAYQLPRDGFIGFSPTGWITTEQFYGWIANHFIVNIPAIRPVVLLIDGHSSHIDYHTSKLCKDNDVHLFRLPPHISHAIQPCDKYFFANFKKNWTNEVADFTVANPGMQITKKTFGGIFSEAYRKTCSVKVVQDSFEATGI